ncbi:Folate-biopterin transporter protein [Dioscorea alata]|uniref:Folate-biopterin transporter protein n=1 Tax=Dioscorea alata TaxID=55571 RepID=A0ACB7UDM6_DIOAL|nr:Folate-biopterin transporter protein [Dioscorea alata]
MAIGWVKKMKSNFGASFLWLVCLIYFTQGFRSFVWTAVSYQMKDVLGLSPSASQFVVSIAYFPWSIKPLYGILSDSIPIKGRKRVPYLVLATSLSLVPWVILGLPTPMRSSRNFLTILLTLQNIGSAMADVVIDAMIAEAVRSELAAFAGDLQSLSWSAMAIGGICGSLLGGYTLSNLKIETIFLLFSVLPTIQLISCSFVSEVPSGDIETVNGKANGHLKDDMNGRPSNGNSLSHEKSKSESLRRRKNGQQHGQRQAITTKPNITEQKRRSLIARSFISIKTSIFDLCKAFKQPIILRPMAWFFLSHVTVPNLSTVMFYYQTDVLHLESAFLGNARVVGWLGLMVGTYTYNRCFKHLRLRKILMWTHIGLAVMNFLDIVLVSRLHVQFGIPDKYMVLFGSALGDAINQFKMMPFLILSGQLCPPGIEGTLFALFMSINNLGNTFGSFLGAALASLLNISSESFDKLVLGLNVQLISTFIPVAFLFLIPKDATGQASS